MLTALQTGAEEGRIARIQMCLRRGEFAVVPFFFGRRDTGQG